MTFFSPEFVLLFLLFFVIYWAAKSFVGMQKLLILFGSYAFICANSLYFALVLFGFTCAVFVCGKYLQEHGKLVRLLEQSQKISEDLAYSAQDNTKDFTQNSTHYEQSADKNAEQNEQKPHAKSKFAPTSNLALGAIISFCVLFLCFFKYYDFFYGVFAGFFEFFGLSLFESVAFPLGISYYTFMSITYLLAMHRGQCEKCDDFISLACFLAFFPSIVMGPISRASDEKGLRALLPQFNEPKTFSRSDEIFTLIIFACVKLLIISSLLSPYVSGVFSSVYSSSSSASQILLAILLYGVVLYANFSGFIDMSRALALALGFELAQNFAMPYAARNIREFWQRWHITLTTFITRYVYIPLGGSAGGFARTQINVLIAFGLSGIWHGAEWSFLIWGVLHGIALMVFNAYKALGLPQLNYYVSVIITYIFVSFAWIFFANDFENSLIIINELFSMITAGNFGSQWQITLVILLLVGVGLYHKCAGFFGFCAHFLASMPLLPKATLLGLVFSVIIAIMPSGIPTFIYASF